MKKIGLCFFGVAYRESYLHHTNNIYQINYEKSINNYKNFLFKFLKDNDFEYDIFFSTYSTEKNEGLLEYLKPTKYTFVEEHIENRIHSRNLHFINSLQNCVNYANDNEIEYDYILMTRFDLKFQIPFNEVKFDFETLNLVSILEKPEFIDDNLYLFPFNKAEEVLKLSIDKKKIIFHHIKKNLENIFPKINYLKNDYCKVANLTFYKINRILLFKKRRKRTSNKDFKKLIFKKEQEEKENKLKKEKWLRDKEFMIMQREKNKKKAIELRKKNIETAIQLRKNKKQNQKQNKKIPLNEHTKNKLNEIKNLHKININTIDKTIE